MVDDKPITVKLPGCEDKIEWNYSDKCLAITIPAAWNGRHALVFAIGGFVPWDDPSAR